LYAVQKKYSDDNGGQLAAMLTYYGFLSLFPLLLVATSLLQIFLHSHQGVREEVINNATKYFPVLGDQLSTNVHSLNGAGIALAIGIVLTLWGAKGVADVFQSAMNHIWGIPRYKRPGFPRGPLKSIGIVVLAGAGFILAAIMSGYASSIDKNFAFRILSILISMSILFCLFWLLFKWGLAHSSQVSRHALLVSSAFAAIGLEILQLIGGYLVTHQLQNLKHLYGTFAATLVLLFWIYLQARVVIYAAEAGTVSGRKLWPRAIVSNRLTEADRRAYKRHAKKERFIETEDIDVGFQE
jgi:membrane protein